MTVDIGFLTAFLGGTLALLSPCGALLLPAFFASTVGARGRLLVHGAVFYLGLAVTLVPLGLGAALLGAALSAHRGALVIGAGVLIVAFGVLQVLGIGFDLRRLLPGSDRIQAAASRRRTLPRTFLLGTVSGVAGFCAGPILGAVLTLAAAERSALLGGAMLAVYAAGMVVPLVVLAWSWTRLGTGGRARLRGHEVQVGRLRVHTTSAATGLLLIAVGITFLLTNGMVALPELISASTQVRLQQQVTQLGARVPDVAVVAAATVLAVAGWFLLRRRSVGPAHPSHEPVASEPAGPVPDHDLERPTTQVLP
ncbi:cytochrome c biogenesis CcdA family protein [Actinotalea sp. K2]|uniref:cytochrome c biogenesis CcdA family protein n=1 Tax=Actinotalea sp. K2 TaxID=2939438 RepID=UPI00201739AF|nr:cytochrome c biogenesis CcdA family protein [Actinotalea sp. K2]MCL3862275.1 cytochrome c biogenesis CcdA family protein [Actinotalea sp. K2]